MHGDAPKKNMHPNSERRMIENNFPESEYTSYHVTTSIRTSCHVTPDIQFPLFCRECKATEDFKPKLSRPNVPAFKTAVMDWLSDSQICTATELLASACARAAMTLH